VKDIGRPLGFTPVCREPKKPPTRQAGGEALHENLLKKYTLPKFNMELENDGSRKESTIPGCLKFRFHVKLWEGI